MVLSCCLMQATLCLLFDPMLTCAYTYVYCILQDFFLACNTLWGEIPVISLQEFSESHPQNLLLFFCRVFLLCFIVQMKKKRGNSHRSTTTDSLSRENWTEASVDIHIKGTMPDRSENVTVKRCSAGCNCSLLSCSNGIKFLCFVLFSLFYYRGCVVTLFSFSWYFLLCLHDITFKGTDVGTELHQFKSLVAK